MKTYQEVLEYLDSFFNLEKLSRYRYSRELKLDRMRDLLEIFDNPQDEFKAIHIAGSKGKGTVAVSLYHVLKGNGYKVGLYTSPHLLSLRERIRYSENKTKDPLNFGDTISEEDLIELVKEIKPKLDNFFKKSKWGKPTFFEVYTLLAFLYFAKVKPDFVIIETGLGGRLDATNVLNPTLTVITKIQYEHTDKLGSTIEQIATEKAGIIKRNTPCVIGLQKWPSAVEVFKRKAEQLNAPLFILGENIKVKIGTATISVNINGHAYHDFKTNLSGSFQLENLALTLTLAHLLKEKGYDLKEEKIRKALLNIYWPGRFQILKEKPLIIIDSAHTPESMETLGKELKRLYLGRPITVILAISKDKDKKRIIEAVRSFSEEVIFTHIENPRLCKAEELASVAQNLGDFKFRAESNFRKLFHVVLSTRRGDPIYVISGSIFLVAEALRIWFSTNFLI